MKRSIRQFAPAEGWLTVGLVAIICLTMARAYDDARWVLGREEYLDLLIWAALGGVFFGFIGPKVGWGRWLTYLVGSVFAALIVPILTALAASTAWQSLGDLYRATAHSAVEAYIDLAIRRLSATPEILHHILVFGLIVWGTSMFASYAVFGHHRPLGGIVVVGVILISNMAITGNDQLPYLVVFSLAALLLLVRSHVYDEESEWIRRRIGEPGTISAVYLRGGTIFIGATVAAAFLLTQTASSAPLAGAWGGVQNGVLSISSAVSRFFPTGGSTRPIGLAFGPGALGQVWEQNPGTALLIDRDPRDPAPYYWRVATYDQIDYKGRTQSETDTVDLGAKTPLAGYLAADGDEAGRQEISFSVTPQQFQQPLVVSPATPSTIDEPIKLSTSGTDRDFAFINRSGGEGIYRVTADVAVAGTGPGELNESALRATGTTYPEEIERLYTGLPDGMFGPFTLALEDQIVAEAQSDAPIDLANSAVRVLQRDFDYKTDIRELDCRNVSAVECFAEYKEGFCQYYAATMAAILRDLEVPTRVAEGFLPGAREGAVETIKSEAAHEWVEVYFPDYGWVTFDPTPASVSRLAALPSGKPLASADAAAAASIPPAPTRDPRGRETDDGPAGSIDPTGRGSLGPLVAVGLLLLVVVLGLAFLAWQRGPRGSTNVDGAYGTVIRIASRFGFGPRPAETVFEYAGALGDVLPDIRPELQTVAQAKVESVYGQRLMSDERLAGIRAAQRRLRVGLLKLAFRRSERRRR
jgi:transglutaminase-like putative cysteine protease